MIGLLIYGLSTIGCWAYILSFMATWEKATEAGDYTWSDEGYFKEVAVGVAGFSVFPFLNTIILLILIISYRPRAIKPRKGLQL